MGMMLRAEKVEVPPQALKVPQRSITNYMWVDDSRREVKIYVEASEEPMAVAAAGNPRDALIQTEFKEQGFKVAVLGERATHVLAIDALEHAIVPAECKARVSTGKRITITLR